MKKKVAIIGSGIAGMSAAYFLNEDYDITLIEKDKRIGGHTNTVYTSNDHESNIPIDTGFMVFNEVTYPNLTALFKELEVPYKKTDMSFSVQHRPTKLEYNGSSLNGLFAQRTNILNPKYIKMLFQINRFNQKSPEILNDPKYDNYSISDYVEEMKLGEDFYYKFLVPMSSAVWSTPVEKMGSFPAKSLIRFFYNHGFLGLNTQHQWQTVCGGSQTYKEKITSFYQEKIIKNDGAKSIEVINQGENQNISITTESGQKLNFDKVIVACHGDDALKLLSHPTPQQNELLSKFKYQENIALLHTDESVMPKSKGAWSSWNYVINNEKNNEFDTYTIYWMNQLQDVSKYQNYFININGEKEVDESKILKKIVYQHPLFDQGAISAQKKLFELNMHSNGIFFCGSYFRYGFHEDALLSSVNLCNFLLNREVLSVK